jgi:hypothetical protein
LAGKSTVNALLARSVDSGTANRLAAAGYTLSQLVEMELTELHELGLKETAISAIRKERTSIPEDTCIQLIFLQRAVCCVCRERGRPYILHHIISWEESHSHDLDNLALLCLLCHNEAHTHHENSRNLTPVEIRECKKLWVDRVKVSDREVMDSPKLDGMITTMWDYFNHDRIIDLSENKELDQDYREFFSNGRALSYLYSGSLRSFSTYGIFETKLHELLSKYTYYLLDNHSTASEIAAIAKPGVIVLLTAYHAFKPESSTAYGPGQTYKGYYRRNRICFSFVIDLWNCTSESSHTHLRGHYICTSVLLIKNVERNSSGLDIQTTCLAVGEGIIPYEPNPVPAIAYRDQELVEGDEEYLPDQPPWSS